MFALVDDRIRSYCDINVKRSQGVGGGWEEESVSYDWTTTITKSDYRVLDEFRYAIRQFIAASERIASDQGLTTQQHQALLAIAGCPPNLEPTIGYLAERLLIEHNSAVGLVNRVAELGLVEREVATTDRRHVLVRLTPQGDDILGQLSASHRQELESFAPRLIDALRAIIETDNSAGSKG
jgi:DNA-binding MarR family transcriptional regulator